MKRAKHPICTKIVKRIEKLKDNLQLWIPRWCGSEQFEVTGPTGNQYRVDLVNRTCGCRKWDMSGIPFMLPLDVKKRSGRPKKARRRELEEPQDPTKLTKKGVQMRCSACGKKSHVDASTSAANVPSVLDPATNVPSVADPVAPTNGNTTMVRSPALAPHQPPMASQESMASSALTMVNRTTLASSGKLVWRGRVVRLASSYKKTPK
ncbi:hypothetical protein Vadar_029742 [Vaccinium darrowii]|uniref:Uncharacterized protein n=1 Tax=Vaccinium darrowii TaxID=229202 RepID=A0ACB7ZNT9_9ERIC|nr:hypothetical protein Vadar_029742 [Vaccinium darrowii]